MADYELDDLDRRILHELEDDGRKPLREIARTVGSSEATIRARVKRLQDLKILRIVAFADPEQLGDTQLSLVLLKVDPQLHDEVVARLVEFDEITYVSTILGRVDLCVELSSKDNKALWSFLREQVMVIEGVRDLNTMSIVKVHKLRYTSPAIG